VVVDKQSPTSLSWRVGPEEVGVRLDVVVANQLEDVSRARVRKWIDDELVRVDGKPARASRMCREQESIEVTVPDPVRANPDPEDIPLAILYEDEDLVVVDKAAGMVVHPSAGHATGTLVNALLAHCTDLSGIGGVERPGIVHRLDIGTTGVLVVAKSDRAHHGLTRQFEERAVKKHYLGIVHGATPIEWKIDRAIGRDPIHRTKISSRTRHPKPALSEARQLESLPASSLLAIQIHTGRTHQIRVHMSEAGYPLVGDKDYGAPSKPPTGMSHAEFAVLRDFPRPALHAATLELTHPTKSTPMNWEAPLPPDMKALLDDLRHLRESKNT
jgi:23S rRNA pseudouridine1911/1915/1917 synthase